MEKRGNLSFNVRIKGRGCMIKNVEKTLQKDFETHLFNQELGCKNHIQLLIPYAIVPPVKYIPRSIEYFKVYDSLCMSKSFDYALEMLSIGLNGDICTGYWNPLLDYIEKIYVDGIAKYIMKQAFHMWIEIENNTIVFDGVFQNFFMKEDYYRLFGIQATYKMPFEVGLDQDYRGLFQDKMYI
jgi:hypothetical protein